jgi:hypothetical protein
VDKGQESIGDNFSKSLQIGRIMKGHGYIAAK